MWVMRSNSSLGPCVMPSLIPPRPQPVREDERVVVAALSALSTWHPTELGRPVNDRIVEHPTLQEVFDKSRRTAGHAERQRAVIARDVFVRVSVPSRKTVVPARPNLDEADASFEQPPHDQALSSEDVGLFEIVDLLGDSRPSASPYRSRMCFGSQSMFRGSGAASGIRAASSKASSSTPSLPLRVRPSAVRNER